jgi:hypothetical protein
MARHHMIDNVEVPFTSEEEAAADAAEADFAAKKPDREMAALREERNTLLDSSDWTQYTDSPLTDEAKAEWVTYRQTLRDLPANTDDPNSPTWPDAPE